MSGRSFKLQSTCVKVALGLVLLTLATVCSCRQRLAITPTPQMDIEERFRIKVLLFDDIKEFSLTVPSAFAVGLGHTHYNPVRFAVAKNANAINVRVSKGKVFVGEKVFESKLVTILPKEPFVFGVNGRNYRGNLTVAVSDDGVSFDLINVVPLEAYINGVVGSEMPNYWEPEALKAQAIAARTYALYIKKRFGSRRGWDVRATQANQVYRGVEAESPQVKQAVRETYGQILLCRQESGKDELFPSYYSSTCGGHTESSKNVFGDSFRALGGVVCPYCKDVVRASVFYWPMVRFDKKLVSERVIERYPSLKKLGEVVSIVPHRKSDYSEFSRVTSVKLTGSTGQTGYLRAEDFRLTVDPAGAQIRSTIFRIADFGDQWAFVSGRGYGHGVGLCQCGAQGMARMAKTAEEILSYYYPSSKIATVY